jgi:hypothetical protein
LRMLGGLGAVLEFKTYNRLRLRVSENVKLNSNRGLRLGLRAAGL